MAGFHDFGIPHALSFAVEEQGRKTLHTHMTFYTKGYKDPQNDFFFKTGRQKLNASRTLRRHHEHVASTRLFPERKLDALKAFDHECTVDTIRQRSLPLVVGDQQLRNLRNKQGHKDTQGHFATCPHCLKKWTHEDLVASYVIQDNAFCQPILDADSNLATTAKAGSQTPKARMLAKVLEFQKNGAEPPHACVNSVHQHHLSCHVSNCFKCQKKGSKRGRHSCGPTCECRHRLPDRKRPTAEIMIENEGIPWCTWHGSSRQQPLAQIIPKRNTYDLFQNVSCNATSHSKFTCNSNVSLILDGPIGQCMHKCQQKANQDEESADYKEVEAQVKKFNGERVHENDRSEASRLICRASFAHNKRNVISPCFASHLLRHDSRFYYSHQFCYCPLKDVVRIHNKQAIRGTLKFSFSGDCFFENAALNYLCRSKQLEDLSLRDFTERYYARSAPRDFDPDEVFPFEAETVAFQHPSVLKRGSRKGKCSQGLQLRDAPALMRVSQWMFPDTAEFKADMLVCDPTAFTRRMEECAQLVLCLFVPHRCKEDLMAEGGVQFPHITKLQHLCARDEMRNSSCGTGPHFFTPRNTSFLQNLQNCRSNSLRHTMKADDLGQNTEPYNCPNGVQKTGDDDDDDEEQEETAHEVFASQLEEEFGAPAATDTDAEFLIDTLQDFKFTNMRNKGQHNCGCKDDTPVPQLESDGTDFALNFSDSNDQHNRSASETDLHNERPTHTVGDIVRLHLSRSTPRLSRTVWDGKNIDVKDATGSIKSIREWSKAAFGTDKKQQRAFEVITAAFLLTFYDESPEHQTDATDSAGATRAKHRKMKRAPLRLRGCNNECNLMCLLHGPGGSGKSTVINAVKAYAANYCKQLGHKFTSRTIIVTAMSGVAATLLNGETTHSVLGLNRDSAQVEEAEDWKDARLLIIDEVSFASHNDFVKMHEHLKTFMKDHYKMFGGINIVFAGDYSQLEPVGRDPVCKDDNFCPEFHGGLNCYIELDGRWRFRNDPEWGERMHRFRIGEPTLEDAQVINAECHVSEKKPPLGIQVATFRNKDRDAVNSAVFEDFCKEHGRTLPDGQVLESACVIFMDELSMHDSSKTHVPVASNAVKRHFHETCSENDCNQGKKEEEELILVLNCAQMLQ